MRWLAGGLPTLTLNDVAAADVLESMLVPFSGRVALDDYVDLVAKLKAKTGVTKLGSIIPGRPGQASQNKAVLGGATGSSSHTIDQEECVLKLRLPADPAVSV